MTDEEQDTTLVEIDPSAPPDSVPNDDGTTTVYIDSEKAQPQDTDWTQNLAEVLSEDVLDALGKKYLDLIEEDVEARKERDQMQADGLKKAGIGEPAPGGAEFEGASRVTHPVLVESYVDFSASAIKELFPPNGPVRTKVDGKASRSKMDRAKRKAEFMNWQLVYEVQSYRPELERLLTQLPVGGSQYMKFYWNDDKQKPDVEFVPIDDMILPYEARNFFDLQRKFHRMNVTDFQYERRVRSGMYRDFDLAGGYGSMNDQTDSAKASDRIEGKKQDYSSETGARVIYEGCVYDDLDGDDHKLPDGKIAPYLITIDDETGKVLSLYRNWKEDDDKYNEIEYLVDYTFIPWRGVYGLSLLQCLAGLPDAITGSLRALLDSAHINNMQGGLKLKSNSGGASLSIAPTQITEMDGMGADDIRKLYMPIPFNQPSPMLFQLLGFLTEAAKSVVGTAEEKISDASNNMPVGTTLALIEQGAKVFSAIHARLHDSQRRCLEILHRLNRDHLPDGKVMYGSDPEDFVTREDFEGSLDVHPVSDPNIFSEAQRFAQIQFVLQSIVSAAPVIPQVVQLFKLREVYARAFEMAKIPEYEEFLPEIPTEKVLNPVDENINIVMGKPVKAYAGQNHEAHIQVLLDFAQNPLFGQSPIIASKFIPGALNHLQDHLLVWYEEMMKLDAGKGKDMDWDNDPQASIALASACPIVDKASTLAFEKIPALIAAAMQKLQAMAPKPPVDPYVQIEQGKLSVQQQKIQSDAQSKVQILQQKLQEAQQDYNLEMQKAGLQSQTTLQTATLQSQTDLAQTLHDNQSAQTIAAMKIASDEHTRLSTGASLSEG